MFVFSTTSMATARETNGTEKCEPKGSPLRQSRDTTRLVFSPPHPKDALSAEITARRRNAVRLAEAQAAMKEGGRESAVQAVSGLRARCLELEELVARLTREIQTAQEDLSSQVSASMAARATGCVPDPRYKTAVLLKIDYCRTAAPTVP